MPALPKPVKALARRQDSVVFRHQLLDIGCTPGQIDHWLVIGLLEPAIDVQRFIPYRVAGAAWSARQQVRAAVSRARGWATGPTVLALHGIEGYPLARRPVVVVEPDRRVRDVPFKVLYSPVPEVDRDEVDGIPAVALPRGFIDAQPLSGDKQFRVGLDDAVRRGLLRVTDLEARAVELGRHRGASGTRRVLASGTLRHESEGERRMARLFLPGDPVPQWQVWVLPGIRVDGCFLEARLVLEYISRAFHAPGVALDGDGIRELKLTAANLLVLRITAGMLRGAQLAVTREQVLATYRDRLALGLSPIVPVKATVH